MVEDAYNNVVANNSSTVTVALGNGSSGNASLVGTTTVTAANGIANFDWVVGTTAGNYTLTVTDGNLTPATSNLFTITEA